MWRQLKKRNPEKVEVWLRGGLGNQLFQYAFARQLSERKSSKLIIRSDLLPTGEDTFNGHSRWPEQISSFNHKGELFARRHQPLSGTHLLSKAMTLQRLASDFAPKSMARLGVIAGNRFLDWDLVSSQVSGKPRLSLNNYFNDTRPLIHLRETLRDEIRAVLQPSPRMFLEASRVSEKMAIHIRLGDNMFLKTSLLEKYVDVIHTAMEELDTLNLSPEFALFSDDMPLALRVLKEAGLDSHRVSVVDDDGLQPIETLFILSNCSGLIASPSTFAWWGGFLQEKADNPVIFKSPWSIDPRNAPTEKIFLSEWLLLPKDY